MKAIFREVSEPVAFCGAVNSSDWPLDWPLDCLSNSSKHPEQERAGADRRVGNDHVGRSESDRPLDTDFGIAAQADYIDRALTALRVPRADVVGVRAGEIEAAIARAERG